MGDVPGIACLPFPGGRGEGAGGVSPNVKTNARRACGPQHLVSRRRAGEPASRVEHVRGAPPEKTMTTSGYRNAAKEGVSYGLSVAYRKTGGFELRFCAKLLVRTDTAGVPPRFFDEQLYCRSLLASNGRRKTWRSVRMSLTDLASIGSLISSVAVLISLIYLALQVRQAEKNQQASIRQGRANATASRAGSACGPSRQGRHRPARPYSARAASAARKSRQRCAQPAMADAFHYTN